MGQAEDSTLQVWQLTELKQTKEWERFPNRFWRLYETLLPKTWESIVKKGQQEKQSDQDPNTKWFKRTLIYLDMDTQYPHFRGNFLYQATKRHLNNK